MASETAYIKKGWKVWYTATSDEGLLKIGMEKIANGELDWGFNLDEKDEIAAANLLDDLDDGIDEFGDAADDDDPSKWNDVLADAMKKGFSG